jgi:hypothetical protein
VIVQPSEPEKSFIDIAVPRTRLELRKNRTNKFRTLVADPPVDERWFDLNTNAARSIKRIEVSNNFPTVLVRERDHEILIRQGAEEISLDLDEGQRLILLLREALEVIH